MNFENFSDNLDGRLIPIGLRKGEGYSPPVYPGGFYYSAKAELLPNDGTASTASREGEEVGSSTISVLAYSSIFAGKGSELLTNWPPKELPGCQDAIFIQVGTKDGPVLCRLGMLDGLGSYDTNSDILTEEVIKELSKLDVLANLGLEDYIAAIERAKTSASERIASSLGKSSVDTGREAWAATALAFVSVGQLTENGGIPINLFNAGDVAGFLIKPERGEDEAQYTPEQIAAMSLAEQRKYYRQSLKTQVQRAIGSDNEERVNKLINSVTVYNPARIPGIIERYGDPGILRQRLYEGQVILEKGQSLLLATDGFWEIIEALAISKGISIEVYLRELIASCPDQTNESLAQKLDEVLKHAYNSIIEDRQARLTDGHSDRPERFRPDHVGFMFIRHV